MDKRAEYKRKWYEQQKLKKNSRCEDCGKIRGVYSTGTRCKSCSAKIRTQIFPPPSQKGTRHRYWDGENNPNWKGGFFKLSLVLRNCPEYKDWRKRIFEQDDYTCQGKCKKRGGRINADHNPVLFSELLRKYDIKTYEQGRNCKELWEATGQVLCREEHVLKDRLFYGNQYTKIS